MSPRKDRRDFPHRRRNRLYKSRDRVLAGVCSGVAEHFDWSVWAVRLVALGLQFTVVPYMFVVYLVLALVLRPAPDAKFPDYEEEEFWNVYQDSRREALRKVHRLYETLERRLQRMERKVTSETFDFDEELRKS